MAHKDKDKQPKKIVVSKKAKSQEENLDEIRPQTPSKPVESPFGIEPEWKLSQEKKETEKPAPGFKASVREPMDEAIKPQAAPSAKRSSSSRKKEHTQMSHSQKTSQSPLALIFSLLAIVSVIGVFYFSYQNQIQLQKMALTAANEKSSTLMQAQKSQILTTRMNELQEEQKALKVTLKETHEKLSNSQERLKEIGGSSDDWLLSEAKYLVQMSDDRLSATGDVETALRQLKSASERLTRISSYNLKSIQAAIAQDIDKLESVKKLDKPSIWAKIGVLKQKVMALEFVEKVQPQEIAASQEKEANAWKSALDKTWGELKTIISIKERDPNFEIPSLGASESYQLKYTLGLILEQARWGLLQEQPSVYRNSLATSIDWLKTYFKDQPQAQIIKSELDALVSLELETPLPSLAGSLNELGRVLDRNSWQHRSNTQAEG